jgi:hypothetical protein
MAFDRTAVEEELRAVRGAVEQAWNVNMVYDLRFKMCIDQTAEDTTIHHELGHDFYSRAYAGQPVIFRDSANDGFHEAIGDTIALSVTPEYLVKVGLLDRAPDASGDIALMLRTALERPAFLPFGLVVDAWRWQVFSGQVPPESYNRAWWELRERYQGVRPASARGEEYFDPGAKYHIPAKTPRSRRGSTSRIRAGPSGGERRHDAGAQLVRRTRQRDIPRRRRRRRRPCPISAPVGLGRHVLAILRRVRDDGGHFLHGAAHAAVALREQPAELVHRVDRVKTNHGRVSADPRARVQSTRPPGQIVALEGLEQVGLHTRGRGDLLDGNLSPFAVPAKPGDECFLGEKRVLRSHWGSPEPPIRAIPAPRGGCHGIPATPSADGTYAEATEL